MREILFKAKRIDNGKWVEGYYQKRYDEMERERHYIFLCKSNIVWEYAEIDIDTLCWYTGKNDNNSNKIWEHDIVKQYADTDELGNDLYFFYEILWNEESACFEGYEIYSAETVSFDDLSDVEVVGNQLN